MSAAMSISNKAGALIACSTVIAMTATGSFAQSQSFFDDFDTLDLADRWYISDGWSNGDHQNCEWSRQEIDVRDGILYVGFSDASTATRDYRCGELQSRPILGFGTFEARIRTPGPVSGMNAAFFTYIGPVHGQLHDEIDFEVLLRNTGRVHTGTFVSAEGGFGATGNGQTVALPYPSESDFIDYAFVWSPDRLDMYLNGELARTISAPGEVPQTPQKIYFSLWGTDTLTEWMGPFEYPGEPIAMEIDWVAYTAPGEPCQFEQSLICLIGPQ